MYEHPYLIYRAVELDGARAALELERARVAREHPERLVARRGWWNRMLHRGRPARAVAPSAVPRPAAESA
ncbi:hypothetical protein WDU99_15925 [Microbacterium sp. Mu-80]|uniref:Uncharacterized protein n=1 Tax=Microbacterium bandirmense TaxID=3122050 RepID=A0ABU8LEP6_9MICO